MSARAGAARRKWTAATGSHTMSAMSKAATLSVMFEPRSGAGLSGSCVAHWLARFRGNRLLLCGVPRVAFPQTATLHGGALR